MNKKTRKTIEIFFKDNVAKEKLAVLTAYDYPMAKLAENAGADVILVGDSMGTAVFGKENTLSVTMEDIIRATRSVVDATEEVFVIADMPFMSYQISIEEGIRNAGRLIVEGGAHAVKLEGASKRTCELIEAITNSGIPVVGHLGLTPQSVNTLGGYSYQAKNTEDITLLLMQCQLLEEFGALAVVLECIPQEVAAFITQEFEFASIGIGSGAYCNGEVQVMHDILNLGEFKPKHAKVYADISVEISRGFEEYVKDVKGYKFPTKDNSISIESDLLEEAQAIYDSVLEQKESLERGLDVDFVSSIFDEDFNEDFDEDSK